MIEPWLNLWDLLTLAEKISVAALVIGIPAATYYPFMFLRLRWYESGIGVSMLLKGIALSAILWAGLGTLAAFIYMWDWYEWVQTFTNCLLVLAVHVQVLVLRRVQRSGEVHEKMGVKRDH